jgi:hypothetical protein
MPLVGQYRRTRKSFGIYQNLKILFVTFFPGRVLKRRKIVSSAQRVFPEEVGAPINVFSSVA